MGLSALYNVIQGSVTRWRVTVKEVNASAASSLVKKKKEDINAQTGQRNCQKHMASQLPALEGKMWCFHSDRERLKEEPHNFVRQAVGLLCLPPCAQTVC